MVSSTCSLNGSLYWIYMIGSMCQAMQAQIAEDERNNTKNIEY